jgi:transposase InsO family protein
MLEFWRNPFGKEARGKETTADQPEAAKAGATDAGANAEPAVEARPASVGNPVADQAAPTEASTATPTAGAAPAPGGAEVPAVQPPPAPPAPTDTVTAVAGADEPLDKPWQANLRARPKGRRLVKAEPRPAPLTGPQRLLLLDTWRRSGLPAGDFAALVGLSRHTLYAWKKAFDRDGPAGLMDRPRGGPTGSKLPDLTRRTILMLKEAHPDWGCQHISDVLRRDPALPASAGAVARVLHEAGYQLDEVPTRPHPDKVRHFERARPNQLWQTDLFSFVLKRQNRRVYLVAFLDDRSRFLVGYGLHASQSTPLVLEVLRAALTAYGVPQEILTDNGSQYVTWRGKSAFTRELEQRGIRQIVAAPRHPQTLGKIERFWGTLWRECLETAVFVDLADARRRLGWFIDYYNLQRPHQGIDGLVPADRFFGAAPEVLRTLKERVAANALALARDGRPGNPFYLTGHVGGQPFSVHAEGERVILTPAAGERREIDLVRPEPTGDNSGPALPEPLCPQGIVTGGEGLEEPPAPGTSALDTGVPCRDDDPLAPEGGDV